MLVLLTIHSITRWLAILVAAALIIRLALGLVKKLPFDKTASALTSAFGGVMDLQLLLGLLFFIIDGFATNSFPRHRWEHGTTMILAVVVAHLPAMWKKLADGPRTRNTLAAVLVSLLLIIVGVTSLGWQRWLHIIGLF